METKQNFLAAAKTGIISESSQMLSIKARNILLRRIITLIDRKENLSEKRLSHVNLLFSTVKNFYGCEKYFYECMISMHFSKNSQLMAIAKDFQQEINGTIRPAAN